MRKIGLVIACLFVFVAPASAQKSEIDAVNAKWMEFFNKGDFDGKLIAEETEKWGKVIRAANIRPLAGRYHKFR